MWKHLVILSESHQLNEFIKKKNAPMMKNCLHKCYDYSVDCLICQLTDGERERESLPCWIIYQEKQNSHFRAKSDISNLSIAMHTYIELSN